MQPTNNIYMAGLNYGKSFKRGKGLPNREGVFYSELSKQFIVRVKNENGNYISIGQDSDKNKALEILYNYKSGSKKW